MAQTTEVVHVGLALEDITWQTVTACAWKIKNELMYFQEFINWQRYAHKDCTPKQS